MSNILTGQYTPSIATWKNPDVFEFFKLLGKARRIENPPVVEPFEGVIEIIGITSAGVYWKRAEMLCSGTPITLTVKNPGSW